MRYRMKPDVILQHLQTFVTDKKALGEAEWTGFSDFKKNFFYWLKYQKQLPVKSSEQGAEIQQLNADGIYDKAPLVSKQ